MEFIDWKVDHYVLVVLSVPLHEQHVKSLCDLMVSLCGFYRIPRNPSCDSMVFICSDQFGRMDYLDKALPVIKFIFQYVDCEIQTQAFVYDTKTQTQINSRPVQYLKNNI